MEEGEVQEVQVVQVQEIQGVQGVQGVQEEEVECLDVEIGVRHYHYSVNSRQDHRTN